MSDARSPGGVVRWLIGCEVDDLSDARLAEWLLGAELSARANAWERLVKGLGRSEASRRWLAAFAASDAADT
jgi:hypothetical protein